MEVIFVKTCLHFDFFIQNAQQVVTDILYDIIN